MTLRCPLCHGRDLRHIATIDTIELAKLYRQKFHLDIEQEFKSVSELPLYQCLDSDLYFFSPMITGSTDFYAKLQNFNWYYLNDKFEYQFARNYIKDSDKILEIGCGKGAFAKKVTCAGYRGLEYNLAAIEKAERAGLVIHNQSIQEHALTNADTYDLVCAFQVLEHIADTRDFLDAAVTTLKKNGLLIVSVPSADSFFSMATNNILNMPPHHVTWWSDDCLQKVASYFSLELLTVKHEELAPIHRRWYATTIIMEAVYSWLGKKQSLVDCSFRHRLFHLFASAGGHVLARGLADRRVLPNGASVIAAYQKK